MPREVALLMAADVARALEVSDRHGHTLAEALDQAGQAELADELEGALGHARALAEAAVKALSGSPA